MKIITNRQEKIMKDHFGCHNNVGFFCKNIVIELQIQLNEVFK